MFRKPNFFLVGAPKCGTSSLAKWLGEHPNCFISKPKEPHFFNTDIGLRRITSLEKYEQLYNDTSESHKAIGEASTMYLQSVDAVPNILKYTPDSRFIAMLRNPIDMVVSLHNQECRDFNENIHDFEKAWMAQQDRQNGASIPKSCVDRNVLLYRNRALIGSQIKRLLQVASKEKIKLIFFDDFKTDPGRTYKEVLSFLNLPILDRSDFSPTNQRRVWRSYQLKRIMNGINSMKQSLHITKSTGLLSSIGKWNVKRVTQKPLTNALFEELRDSFAQDINLLGKITNRDLSYWMQPK